MIIAALKWVITALILLLALAFFFFILYVFAVFVVAAVQKIKEEVQKHGRDE